MNNILILVTPQPTRQRASTWPLPVRVSQWRLEVCHHTRLGSTQSNPNISTWLCPTVNQQSNLSKVSFVFQEKYSVNHKGSHTFLFLSIFLIGFIGVLVFYIYKKSSGSLTSGESRYQYSVLSSNNLLDPDDDSNDPLINNFGRNDHDDENNFLDINRYRYSDDDDVELLGVSYWLTACPS